MNVRRIISLSSILVPLSLLCGCGESSNSAEVATWQVDTAAVLKIGKAGEDPVNQLYRVRGIAELHDGTVAIANQGSSEVRLYDANGRFVRALGRAGQGPGEFAALRDLLVRGDPLYAYDRAVGRLTRFLSSGTYLDDRVLRKDSTRILPNFVGLLGDGTAVGWVSKLTSSADGFSRDSAVLLRFRADGAVGALGEFAGQESISRTRDLGPGMAAGEMYTWGFYRSFRAVAAGNRIYAGVTDSAVIQVWDGAGAQLPSLRWGDVPLPLDDATVDALFERETSNLAPDKRAEERKVMQSAPRPATAPVFDRLVLAPGGELWVRRFDQPGAVMSEWLVFDADGALRARVGILREREIRAIGRGRLYTLERDADDIEYVLAYPFVRSSN